VISLRLEARVRLSIVLSVTAGAALLSGAPSAVAQLQTYAYSAQTAQPARRQGNVVAGGITWACQGQTCATRGPWPRPAVEACRALTAEVGAIASYGHAGAMLNAAELAACNAGVTAVRPAPIRPGAILRPAPRAVTTDVTELAFVGGAMRESDDDAAAVTTSVAELSFVGGDMRPADGDAPPVVTNVEELIFVGR
jgi:hypothetical protein